MIKVSNERVLLPIVRNPLANWSETERLIFPLIKSFMDSDACRDEYKGWAFSMVFIKNVDDQYQDAVASMDMERRKEKERWSFAPSHNDRHESIWINNDMAIVIHQESWLWFD